MTTKTDITLPPLPGWMSNYFVHADLYSDCEKGGAWLSEIVKTHARAAVEADRQRRGEPVVWKPIETAPKDNKRLLYLARLDDQGKLVELDFDGVWEYWQESWELSHINGYCWMSANGIEEPTHWAYQDEPPPTTPQPDEPVKREVYKPEYKYCEDGKVVWTNAADAPVVKSADPVKVPSDEEIDKLSHGFALQYQDHVRGFARALLSRYGSSQPATNEALLDLVSRLRALSRYQHDDMSVADEAADALMSGQPAASVEPDWAPNWNAMLAAARNAGWSFTKSEDGIVRMVPLVHGEAQFASASAAAVAQEPVAVIGADFGLLWVGSGPIAPIVKRHGLKVGSKLYAAPVPTDQRSAQQKDTE